MDLGGLRMCFKYQELDKGAFFVGSADGELVYAEFIKPEGEENPDYTKSCVQVCVCECVCLYELKCTEAVLYGWDGRLHACLGEEFEVHRVVFVCVCVCACIYVNDRRCIEAVVNRGKVDVCVRVWYRRTQTAARAVC